MNHGEIEKKIKDILSLIGEDPCREGLLETPRRVTKMFEEVFSGYGANVKEILGITFNENYKGLVIVGNINFHSMCEHHMAFFFGKAHIGYIPNGSIAGLSKFARLVDAVTKKLQVQERITEELVNSIDTHLNPQGVIVMLEAKHLCMCARGVKKEESHTITTSASGVFLDNASLRNEFLQLIQK